MRYKPRNVGVQRQITPSCQASVKSSVKQGWTKKSLLFLNLGIYLMSIMCPPTWKDRRHIFQSIGDANLRACAHTHTPLEMETVYNLGVNLVAQPMGCKSREGREYNNMCIEA